MSQSGAQLHALTLLVASYDSGIAWFRDRAGFSLVEDTDLGDGKRWVLMRPPGGGAALLLAQPVGQAQRAALGHQTGGRVMGFIATDDFDRDHRKMTASGVEFIEAPRDEPYGRVAVFRDVSGNCWDLIQHR